MNLFNQVVNRIEEARDKKVAGKLNCIPVPFERFSNYYEGIERGKYTLVTANAKVGKSQITDYMFVYHPIHYIAHNASNIDVEVLYYSLEMSAHQKTMQAISHFLYLYYGILKSPKELRSLKEALDLVTVSKIKELEKFFEFYFSKVKYIDNIRNRYGIWLDIFDYAKTKGTLIYEEKDFGNGPKKIIKEYVPNNPDLITIIVIDHASLLVPEKGETITTSINRLSSGDLVNARNLFGFNPVLIQQQMNAQENLEHKKAQSLMPNLAGLADCKDTQRDVDLALGLFSPARHEIANFKGYDVTKYGDRFRSLEILAGREGSGNTLCPLLFLGECSYFEELSLPNTQELKTFESEKLTHLRKS